MARIIKIASLLSPFYPMKNTSKPVRNWTVVLVPEGAGASREVQVSRRLLRGAVAVASVLGVVTVVGIYTAVTSAIDQSQLGRLERQYGTLDLELATMQTRIDQLSDTLNRINELDRDVRLLAGLPLIDPAIRLAGVGGPAEPPSHTDVILGEAGLGREALSTRSTLDGLIRRARILSASFSEAVDSMESDRNRLSRLPSIMPTAGYLSSGFSEARMHPVYNKPLPHYAIDISAPEGTPIVAPAKGRVTMVGVQVGYGNILTIDHGNGIQTRYAHNSEILVRQGQVIERGDKIALVGHTGVVTSDHLHYEVRVNGTYVDPRRFIFGNVIVD